MLDAAIQNENEADDHNDANEVPDGESSSDNEKPEFYSPRVSVGKKVPTPTTKAITDFTLHMQTFAAVCGNEVMYVVPYIVYLFNVKTSQFETP